MSECGDVLAGLGGNRRGIRRQRLPQRNILPVGCYRTTRVRVVSRTQERGRWQLVTAVHDGDSWRGSQVAVEFKHLRIGRGHCPGVDFTGIADPIPLLPGERSRNLKVLITR